MVCTRVPHPAKPGRRATTVWQVQATTNAIIELAEQLAGQGIQRVVVESTSDDWRAWLYLLQARGLVVWLCNARDARAPAGPAEDRQAGCGVAGQAQPAGHAAALVCPTGQIRRLRDDTRLRADLTQERGRQVQRLEQAAGGRPGQAVHGGHRHHGVSGRAMLAALVAGQRDPRRWLSWPGADARQARRPGAGASRPLR
jgi:hypothetical protein